MGKKKKKKKKKKRRRKMIKILIVRKRRRRPNLKISEGCSSHAQLVCYLHCRGIRDQGYFYVCNRYRLVFLVQRVVNVILWKVHTLFVSRLMLPFHLGQGQMFMIIQE